MNEEETPNKMLKSERIAHGCLIAFFVVTLPPTILIGYLFYGTFLKETLLLESTSPTGNHTITIIEKGFLIDPIHVIANHDTVLKTVIVNKRKAITESNVSVQWEDGDNAIITLSGERMKIRLLFLLLPIV